MIWKILMVTGVLGLITVAILLVQTYRMATKVPIQWEVQAVKYREDLPEGWEPFAYDKTSHMVFLKRIKREEVNEE